MGPTYTCSHNSDWTVQCTMSSPLPFMPKPLMVGVMREKGSTLSPSPFPTPPPLPPSPLILLLLPLPPGLSPACISISDWESNKVSLRPSGLLVAHNIIHHYAMSKRTYQASTNQP